MDGHYTDSSAEIDIRSRGVVVERRQLTGTIYLLRLRCNKFSPACAGQFVNLSIPGYFLRRPLAIAELIRSDDGTADISVIFAEVGAGTRALAQVDVGTTIDVLGPLGNGFDVRDVEPGEAPVLVGGGSGIPPLYELAKVLARQGAKPRVFLGFRDASSVYFLDEFDALSSEAIIATEDGSSGVPGFITDVLPPSAKHVYACGPEGMLRSVKRWALNTDIGAGERPHVQLSLEAHMGCGFGACLGCTIPTIRGRERVCLEGPVFDADDVLFDQVEVTA